MGARLDAGLAGAGRRSAAALAFPASGARSGRRGARALTCRWTRRPRRSSGPRRARSRRSLGKVGSRWKGGSVRWGHPEGWQARRARRRRRAAGAAPNHALLRTRVDRLVDKNHVVVAAGQEGKGESNSSTSRRRCQGALGERGSAQRARGGVGGPAGGCHSHVPAILGLRHLHVGAHRPGPVLEEAARGRGQAPACIVLGACRRSTRPARAPISAHAPSSHCQLGGAAGAAGPAGLRKDHSRGSRRHQT